MPKSKKIVNRSALRKAPMATRSARMRATPTPRRTRTTATLPNAEFVGALVEHFIEEGQKGAGITKWYKGKVVEVLPNENFRIHYKDGDRRCIPKAEVLALMEAKLMKLTMFY